MIRTALALSFALALPLSAAAEPPRHEEMKDHAALADDVRDAHQAQDLLNDFDHVMQGKALFPRIREQERVEVRVMDALNREVDEANRETSQAGHEAARSESDVRSKEDELAWDARRGDRREYRDDQRDLQDQRRDAAKDRHDYIFKAEYRRRVLALRDEWARLRGLRRPEQMQRKHDMLVELVDLARMEIRSDQGELREDHRDDWQKDRRERQ